VYVAYINTFSEMIIQYYSWEDQKWTVIMGVVPNAVPIPGYAMAAFGPYVYVGGNFLVEQVFQNLGYWDSAQNRWEQIRINDTVPPPVTSK
jgi:hypothetical protein